MATAKLPPVRIDAIQLVVTTLEVVVGIGTLKVLAYKYHGNPFAQAFLTLF